MGPGMVVFNTSTREAEADLCELKASLVDRASPRTAKTIQRNPVLKNKTKKGAELEKS